MCLIDKVLVIVWVLNLREAGRVFLVFVIGSEFCLVLRCIGKEIFWKLEEGVDIE